MFLLRSLLLVALCSWVLSSTRVQGATSNGGQLTSDEFYQRVVAGDYDVIVDVRRRDNEWNLGHITGATLVESLASYTPNSDTSLGSPSDLAGCEYCNIIVYCRSGVRAAAAIEILRTEGFQGKLWNGLGVSQWVDAGYDLVTTESVVPPCTVNRTVSDACYDKHMEMFEVKSPSMSSSCFTSVSFSLWVTVVGIVSVLIPLK